MNTGLTLTHKKQNFEVVFKSMVNSKEFRTTDDFQFRLDEFDLTVEVMEAALREIDFFVGGLTNEAIIFHFNKNFN